jgi:prepilin-type processing-associated H-X9-DG protein
MQYDMGLPDVRNPGGPRYQVLTPYLKNVQILTCPSTNGTPSYSWCRGGDSIKQGAIPFPAQQVMFGDCTLGWWVTRGSKAVCCGNRPEQEAEYPHRVAQAHNEGANLGFWDGHVKWAKTKSLPWGSLLTAPIQFSNDNRG